MTDWSPQAYLKFEHERTRAARDLLAQVRTSSVGKVVDIGCGPGNSTELLAARYPGARIVGLDNSAAMLEQARRRLPDVRFEFADATDWTPDADVDLVFANAVYHWIPGHLERLALVLGTLRAGATLAVQLPDNIAEPTHRLMREVAQAGSWRPRLAGAARAALPPARAYYEALRPAAERVDVWRTTYHHVLSGAAAIVELFQATGLRPFLAPLSGPERAEFLARYSAAIAAAYPPLADGRVWLPFPRLFIIAERSGAPQRAGPRTMG